MASEELFQTYAADGRLAGLVARSEVHRLGLWHKAVQVFVYRQDGRLLLQQRATTKDLHPGAWDASVGEHLQPGERFSQGAVRGLQEEMNIHLGEQELEQLCSEQRLELAGSGYCDAEIQVAFRCNYDGEIRFNEEVQAVCWVGKLELARMLDDPRVEFTPWFHHHTEWLELVNSLS